MTIAQTARKRIRLIGLKGDICPTDRQNPTWFAAKIELDGSIIGSVEYNSKSEAHAGPVVRYRNPVDRSRMKRFAKNLPQRRTLEGMQPPSVSDILKSLAYMNLT